MGAPAGVRPGEAHAAGTSDGIPGQQQPVTLMRTRREVPGEAAKAGADLWRAEPAAIPLIQAVKVLLAAMRTSGGPAAAGPTPTRSEHLQYFGGTVGRRFTAVSSLGSVAVCLERTRDRSGGAVKRPPGPRLPELEPG